MKGDEKYAENGSWLRPSEKERNVFLRREQVLCAGEPVRPPFIRTVEERDLPGSTVPPGFNS